MPIYLLQIDTPRGLLVDETNGGTLTLDELPGFALTVIPGSATFPDGSKRGTVSVTLVHADKVPMVPNFGQQPRFIITIQPAGTHFNPPAALTMPNVDGLIPGQKTEMYSFDHDLGSFISIGPATVSEDGTVVQSDPGVGVVKGGWHCGGNPSTTGNCGDCRACQQLAGNQCVPDDTNLPRPDPKGNCLRSDCRNGLTILRVDDSDVPQNVPNDGCKTCQTGGIIPVAGCIDTDGDGFPDNDERCDSSAAIGKKNLLKDNIRFARIWLEQTKDTLRFVENLPGHDQVVFNFANALVGINECLKSIISPGLPGQEIFDLAQCLVTIFTILQDFAKAQEIAFNLASSVT